jgi:hypothetical protein
MLSARTHRDQIFELSDETLDLANGWHIVRHIIRECARQLSTASAHSRRFERARKEAEGRLRALQECSRIQE